MDGHRTITMNRNMSHSPFSASWGWGAGGLGRPASSPQSTRERGRSSTTRWLAPPGLAPGWCRSGRASWTCGSKENCWLFCLLSMLVVPTVGVSWALLPALLCLTQPAGAPALNADNCGSGGTKQETATTNPICSICMHAIETVRICAQWFGRSVKYLLTKPTATDVYWVAKPVTHARLRSVRTIVPSPHASYGHTWFNLSIALYRLNDLFRVIPFKRLLLSGPWCHAL